MMQREFNSLNEVLSIIKCSENEVEKLTDDFKDMSKGRIYRLFFLDSYEKEQFKLNKKAMKGEIKARKRSIEELEYYLDETCTFDFDLAMEFIAGALSIIEGEEYQVLDLELSDTHLDTAMFVTTSVPFVRSEHEDITLISTKSNIRMISRLDNEGYLCDRDDIVDEIDDGKYIILDTDEVYTMYDYYDEEAVPGELTETYPYLAGVITGLIDLRLASPELTDEEVVSVMIEEIPKRYSNLIREKTKKK